MTENPLIRQGELLDWANISTADVSPALDVLLADAKTALEAVTHEETPATWQAVVEPLEAALEKLSRCWGAVGHLSGVMDTPEMREAYNANLARVTAFYIALSQNEALFAKYKAIAASADFANLSTGRRRVIEHKIRDFRLSGAELPADKKARMKALGEEGAALGQKFSENLLDATNATVFDITDKKELEGIPADILEMYEQTAKAAGIEGWRITLQMPSYLPIIQYCNNRALREKVFRAYATRASELGPEAVDNTPVIRKILANRKEEAELLGMKNFAEVSLVPKMAESPEAVEAFLTDLAERARGKAERDWKEVCEFGTQKLGLDEVKPWDNAWVSESLRRAKHDYSEQEVRRYFTLDAVFSGLYGLVEKLFEVKISPEEGSFWHEDVRLWKITDRNGKLIARFYTDLYARPTKRGGAWMDNDTSYCVKPDGSVQTPVAYLVCNFTPPVAAGKPSLLTHDDVCTLFHEFGHGLHHMLSRVPEAQLSGISGVEWDAVEMPSQFMENWTWNYEIIRTLSKHADSGEVIPEDLFKKMLAAKNFQSGMFCLRQIEFALFDMRLHDDAQSSHADDFEAVLDAVRKEVAVVPSAPFSRFAQSFSHIFAGGYSAGYYSYKWAEVLSSDAFSAFEDEGLFNPATGKRWVDEVLSRGSSRDAIENFRAFRGRDPSIEALLRHSGIMGD